MFCCYIRYIKIHCQIQRQINKCVYQILGQVGRTQMNILLRLVISSGLLLTALTILDWPAIKGMVFDQQISAYLDHNFYTTCSIIFKSQMHCPLVKKILSGLVVSAAFCILFIESRVVYFIASLCLISWAAFYANPIVDKSLINFDWFLQTAVIIVSFLIVAFRNRKNQ